MSTNGVNDQHSDAPSFQADDKNNTGQDLYGTEVFAADVAETGVTSGIAHSGWIKRVAGSGGRSGRIQYEVLVSSKNITGDATDFANTASPANSSGTADDSILPDS